MNIRKNIFGHTFQRAGVKRRAPADRGAGEHEIEEFLVNSIAATLQVPPGDIDIERGFADYGLDSLQMVNLSGELEEFLGRRISEIAAWDYPSIEKLARYLSGGDQAPAPLEEPIDLTTSLG